MTAASAFPPLFPGDILSGTYRVERVLGRGGMGIVLAARHLDLGEQVAIKILSGEYTEEATSRFLGEAKAAARIRSDHVVRVFEFGRTEDGCPFIVMEYLEGEDLARVLEKGPVRVADAIRWTLEACDALAHAHHDAIVHRDLKPANLFLERRPNGSTRIKLLDFGIAKLPEASVLTGTSQMLGSPMYMAPEQFSDPRDVDVRTDVWGLGSVLYQAITGRRAFDGDTIFEIAARVREEPHVPAASLRAELPDGLSSIIDRCLEKARAGRWPQISALAHAIAPFAAEDTRALLRSIDAMSSLDEKHVDVAPTALIEPFLGELLEALTQLRHGHFTGYLWTEYPGIGQEIRKVFNEHLAFLRAYRDAHLRLMEELGITGRLGGQMWLPAEMLASRGEWRRLIDASNTAASNLTNQLRDAANVVASLSKGETGARIQCDDIQGELRVFREQFNALAERNQSAATPDKPSNNQ